MPEKILHLIMSIVDLGHKISNLMECEIKLAKRHLLVSIMLTLFCLNFIISIWAFLQYMIFTYLLSLNMSTLLSLFFLIIINMLLLFITLFLYVFKNSEG